MKKALRINDLRNRTDNLDPETAYQLAKDIKKRCSSARSKCRRIDMKVAFLEDKLPSLRDRISQARYAHEYGVEKSLRQKELSIKRSLTELEHNQAALRKNITELDSLYAKVQKTNPKKVKKAKQEKRIKQAKENQKLSKRFQPRWVSGVGHLLLNGGSNRSSLRGAQEVYVARRVNI